MQFKHPELLYALFLLLIPILVHLFQLRKFQKEAFTNVAFLKQISIQTRKSNTIKKWLVLLTRLAAIAMLVLAFAQPFFTQSDIATKEKETVIYLDNSFSMQAKGTSGPLLKQSIQDLITSIPNEKPFTLLTNTETYKSITVDNARNTLLQLPYTSEQLSGTAISLKAKRAFSSNPATAKRLIVISDFQVNETPSKITPEDAALHYVQLRPVLENNVVIDSLYATQSNVRGLELTVLLSAQQLQENNIPVSLYNGEQLIAKATAAFNENLKTEVTFEIDSNTQIEGRIVIEDPFLTYDNTLYFSVNTGQPIRVLSINESESEYLQRIFTAPEFSYTATNIKNLDYSKIPDYNFIILNGVKQPSLALANAIGTFSKEGGGSVCVLLNEKGDVDAYNTLLIKLSSIQISDTFDVSRLITTINYDHPLYRDVFDTRITNFQYPSVSSSYNLENGDAVLRFEDGNAFVAASNKTYVVASSFDTAVTNFKNSPLVVPTLYNMAKQSLSLPNLYFTNGKNTQYDIPVVVQKDAVLSLVSISDPNDVQIPLQRALGTKVTITTASQPERSGIYNIAIKDSIIQQVSYNYNRKESLMRYQTLTPEEGASYTSSIANLFEEFKEADSIQSLWKWFVIFALLFLIMEMLILKFFK